MPIVTSFASLAELEAALGAFDRDTVVAAAKASVAPSRQQILKEKEAALLQRAADLGIDTTNLKPAAPDDDIPF